MPTKGEVDSPSVLDSICSSESSSWVQSVQQGGMKFIVGTLRSQQISKSYTVWKLKGLLFSIDLVVRRLILIVGIGCIGS
ncbi:hypothetical protein V6N13_050552 [Hibiscus sabdariffa]